MCSLKMADQFHGPLRAFRCLHATLVLQRKYCSSGNVAADHSQLLPLPSPVPNLLHNIIYATHCSALQDFKLADQLAGLCDSSCIRDDESIEGACHSHAMPCHFRTLNAASATHAGSKS